MIYKPEKFQLIRRIEARPFGVFRAVMFDHSQEKPKLVLDITEHNQVTQVGLNGWAKIANEESGFTGVPNYCALGTGTDTPSISDTILQAEVARTTKVVDSNVRTNNAVVYQFYFGPDVANVNIKEIGAFVDGTASADSGILFDRALLDIVKTSLNSLYIYFTLTFSA